MREHARHPKLDKTGPWSQAVPTQTGQVREQAIELAATQETPGAPPSWRRIEIQLQAPTEAGDQRIALWSNLPENIDAATIAQLYRKRWRIQGLFERIESALHSEASACSGCLDLSPGRACGQRLPGHADCAAIWGVATVVPGVRRGGCAASAATGRQGRPAQYFHGQARPQEGKVWGIRGFIGKRKMAKFDRLCLEPIAPYDNTQLDTAVAAACGWGGYKADMQGDEILRRLLALNLQRAGT